MNHSILVELARTLTQEDFVERLPDPVLVVMSEMVREEASGEGDTLVGEIGGRPGKVHPEVPPQFDVLAIRPKRRGSGNVRVTIGRERTCDIVVRTPGVSKLHASFLPGAPLRLLDEGSQNGTFVDGKRLAANQPVDVKVGAQVVFGDLTTRLVSPIELYGLLKTAGS